MSGRSVAVEGEVTATPGLIPFPPAVSGAWTPGNVSYQKYEGLTVKKVPVIHQARCTFTFSGATGNGAPVSGSETVTLVAKSTQLQNGQAYVLLNGDTQVGVYGNTLTAIASGPLTST